MVSEVLQIVEPGKDGVFWHVDGLCRFLISQGVPVHLAYSSIRSSSQLLTLVTHVRNSGGFAIDLKISNLPSLGDVRAARSISRLVRNTGVSIVHAHSSKAGGLARLLYAVRLLPPVVYTPNAYFGMHGTPTRSARLFWAIERWQASKAYTVNVSDDEAFFARTRLGVSPARQTVIPNAVNVERFSPAIPGTRATARKRFGVDDSTVVLGLMARDSVQKDLPTLYRAFAIATRAHPELRLLHVGLGQMEPLIRELGISDRVVRVEYLADTTPFYQACDALGMSSLFEGHSIAVLEALSSGLPLILSDAPGNRGFFKLGLSHIWNAPVKDVARFAEAIVQWIEDRPAHRPSNHREIAVREFSPESCYGRILELYQRLANQPR